MHSNDGYQRCAGWVGAPRRAAHRDDQFADVLHHHSGELALLFYGAVHLSRRDRVSGSETDNHDLRVLNACGAHLETQDDWQLRCDERAIRDTLGHPLERLPRAEGVPTASRTSDVGPLHPPGKMLRASNSNGSSYCVTTGNSLAPSQQSISTCLVRCNPRCKGATLSTAYRTTEHRVARCSEPRTCSS